MLTRLTLVAALSLGAGANLGPDPLPSWNDGPARRAIVDFVEATTTEGSPDFVPEPDRIAVFDNDGTLWSENPVVVQGAFLFERIRELAPDHPEWKHQQPFRAVLEGDPEALTRMDEHQLSELISATHAGMTTDEFDAVVRQWIATARHPAFGRRYVECVYQPMLELLDYLRAHGFTIYIVSGGGVDFMRAFAEEIYGVPPAQVIGSSAKTRFSMREGEPVLEKLPEIGSVDDKEGKPQNIHLHVGKRPILAFGNSDGDLQMLQYTAAGRAPALALLLHHDDAARESAYDAGAKIGGLDAALTEARQRGWTVVSMKRDWKVVFSERRSRPR